MAAPSPLVLPVSTPQILPSAGGSAFSNPPIRTPAFCVFINHITETLKVLVATESEFLKQILILCQCRKRNRDKK
ncbi:hypothetical protein LguiA_017594 [Lonicera macranthoides]